MLRAWVYAVVTHCLSREMCASTGCEPFEEVFDKQVARNARGGNVPLDPTQTPQRSLLAAHQMLSTLPRWSEYGGYKKVKARFRPWQHFGLGCQVKVLESLQVAPASREAASSVRVDCPIESRWCAREWISRGCDTPSSQPCV